MPYLVCAFQKTWILEKYEGNQKRIKIRKNIWMNNYNLFRERSTIQNLYI